MPRQTRPTGENPIESSVPEDIPKTKSIDAKVNILTIDAVIKANFARDIGSIAQMQQDLTDLISIIMFSKFSDDIDNAKKQSESLRRRINGLKLGAGLTVYQLESYDLIKKYKQLTPSTRKAFVDQKNSEEIKKVTMAYLQIAKKYVNLENFKGLRPEVEPCQECGSVVFHKTEEFGITVCGCGLAKDVLNVAPSYNDSKRVNCSTRFKHNAKGYLEDAMDSFECKQGEISPKTLSIVKKEMEIRGVTPETVSKDDIYLYLTMNRLSESYADINAIWCAITGATPPDLTQYRTELLEMSSQFEPVCKRLIADRVNALTVLWKLYMFLRLLDYPCVRQDFYCLKTTVKQEEHQTAWEIVINELIELYPNEKTSNGKARWRHLERDNYISYSTPIEVKSNKDELPDGPEKEVDMKPKISKPRKDRKSTPSQSPTGGRSRRKNIF